MKIGSMDYDVIGFDEYIKDFEEKAISEFKSDAESMLQRELEEEPKDGESIEIYLEAEKTIEKEELKFMFHCQLSDESLDLVYDHFIQG